MLKYAKIGAYMHSTLVKRLCSLQTEYESAYVNFFALTGLLDRDMSTYQKPNGDFTFQIRVYPHEQQQSVK